MKKTAITALILALSALVFTSCLDKKPGGAGDQAGTSGENIAEPMTTDNVTSDSVGTTETQPITDIGTADSEESRETQGMTDIGTADSEEITGTQETPDKETADSKETKPIEPEKPRETLSNEEIEELRKNAEASLIKLDKKLSDEIEPLYKEKFGGKLIWANFSETDSMLPGVGVRCYGEFDGCVVLLKLTDLTWLQTETIAGCEFACRSSFLLVCYKDGLFYNLQDGYEKGLITKDKIALAAERHKYVEDFLHMNRS